MKKETLVIIFYVLYFVWLFSVTYLSPQVRILDLYSIGIAAFYFLFLREKGDLIWFWFGVTIPLIFSIFSFSNFKFKFDFHSVYYIPIWLVLAWGITFVALRKFFLVITRR